MTREEQIKKQADIYTDDASNYAEWSDDGGWSGTNDIDLVEKAFIEGAKWADSHPKSPWISVDEDLPCYHEELKPNSYATYKVIVLLNDGRIRETYMFYDKWWEYRKKITHWMPFIKPLKE